MVMQRRGFGQHYTLWMGVCLALAAAFASESVRAEPQPSPTPVQWELTLTFAPPQRIDVPGVSRGGRSYWYLLLHVVNDTGEDRDFMPVIDRVEEMESELPESLVGRVSADAPQIKVTPALLGVDPAVYQAIKRRHARTHPFLIPPVEAITRLRQGRDYAIDTVAIFPDLDPRTSRFTVYVGGLSGERQRLPNPSFVEPEAGKPAPKDADKNPRWFVIQKTLAIPFRMPGDVRTRRAVEPQLDRIHWVMR